MKQAYRYNLDRTSKKFKCPHCGSKSFVLYIDAETNQYLPDHVGRCDRENRCGHHYKPAEYFQEAGLPNAPFINATEYTPEPVAPIDFMPMDYVEKSIAKKGYLQSHFAQFLIDRFGHTPAETALLKYFVGRSKIDGGRGCIFWRIDIDQRVRTGKIMSYNREIGKRDKNKAPTWVHKSMEHFNYRLCFFGEHLLSRFPDKTVNIVESEKTAIIASMYMPEYNWLATGGASGCKWREWDVYKVFLGKRVMLYPDFGLYNKKSGKTCFEEWSERSERIRETSHFSIKVSRLLENSLSQSDRMRDFDLADLLMEESPF